MQENKRPELKKSRIIAALPKACGDETAAVEFMEEQRWGDKPTCPHCESENVYKMTDRDGTRSKRYLWRCRTCAEQYTVRIGTVYEDSRLPLKHWCYAFWRAATSKKGVSALEIKRHCQISYKSALFLMHRVRFAMTPDATKPEKMGGTCEVDETFCGGKPRDSREKRAKWSSKMPVMALVQRGGVVAQVVTNVTHKNVARFINANVDLSATINTDQSHIYKNVLFPWEVFDRHHVVNHSRKEYARVNPDGSLASVNHCESFLQPFEARTHGNVPRGQQRAFAPLLQRVRLPLEHALNE
jgi:transposase-like protein